MEASPSSVILLGIAKSSKIAGKVWLRKQPRKLFEALPHGLLPRRLIKCNCLKKTCIFTLGFILSSTVIFAEKADEQNKSSRQTLEEYNQSIRLDPDNAELYRNRGVAYKKLGQFYYALRDFSRAVQLDPNDAGSYSNRGNTYSKLGQFSLAIEDYNQAIHLDPNYAAAYSSRGNGYLNSGNFKLACNDFRKDCELGDCAYSKWAQKNGNCRQ